LDALEALEAHRRAIIVAGAQAIYLRTGHNDIGVAPFTTDGDLALDPTLLGDEPLLEAVMRRAGFDLLPRPGGHVEPGIWIKNVVVEGAAFIVPVDLIIAEAVADPAGRRGARLGPHGNRAAHKALGLEAALVDRTTMAVTALDPSDSRSVEVHVAGLAAMLVAKAHKIHDRVASGRASRLSDKDGADVYRIMQTASPERTGTTLASLSTHPVAGRATATAIGYLAELFGQRDAEGVRMAQRSLQSAIPGARVAGTCVGFTQRLVVAAGSTPPAAPGGDARPLATTLGGIDSPPWTSERRLSGPTMGM
jgi:hypothetical protein